MTDDKNTDAFAWDPNQGTDPGNIDTALQGSFIGDLAGSTQRNADKRAAYGQQKAMQLWSSAQSRIPTAQSMSDPYNYNPDMEGLAQIAWGNGLSPGVQARYAQMAQQAGQQASAQRQAIAQQMAARGVGASGLNYVAQLQAGQAGADAGAAGGYAAVAQGENARNQATSQMAQIRAQQQGNYARAQSDALQQQFEDYMNTVAGATGQYNRGSDYAQRQSQQGSQNQSNMVSNLGTAIISAL